MLRDGYEPEMGLGRNGDGTTNLVKFIENRGRFGLAYEPTYADKRRVDLEMKERSLEESEWAQARYDQLNLIEGKRLTAMSHGRLYQRRVKNAFDKKVRPRKFNEGDLVLKKMSHAVKDSRGKWAPNYEGPFVVKRAFSGGALILTHMDGEELPSPVNSDVVKRYYA